MDYKSLIFFVVHRLPHYFLSERGTANGISSVRLFEMSFDDDASVANEQIRLHRGISKVYLDNVFL